MSFNPKIYRDSISRSNPHDLYEVVRNPYAQKLRVKDTLEVIETEQERLEKEALQKFKANNFLSPQSLVFVGRAGRFLFVALTLPVSIFLYRIPKWLLLKAIPNMFQAGQKNIHKMKSIATNISYYASNLVQGFNRLQKKLMEGFKLSIEYVSWVSKSLKALFVHLKHPVIQTTYLLLKPMQKGFEFANRAFAKVRERTSVLAKKVEEKFKEMAKAVKTRSQAIIHETLLPIITPLVTPLQPLVEYAKFSMKKGKEVVQSLKEKVSKPLQKISKKLWQESKKWLVATQRFIMPVIAWIMPFSNFVRHSFFQKCQQIKSKFDKTIEQVKKVVKPLMQESLGMIQNFLSMALQSINHLARRNKNKKKEEQSKKSELMKKTLAVFAGGFMKLVFRTQGLLVFLLRWLFQFIKRQTKQTFLLFKNYHQIILTILFYLYRFTVINIQYTKRCIHLIRLFIAWSRVLIRKGFNEKLTIDSSSDEEIQKITIK